MRSVEQNAHTLTKGPTGMSVVELNGDSFRECAPIGIAAAEASHEVSQRTGDKEKFLDEAQALTLRRMVIRIEHARDRFCRQRFGKCADEISATEPLEV